MRTIVIAASNHPIAEDFIKLIAENELHYDSISIADSIRLTEQLVRETTPDVLILDVTMGCSKEFYEEISRMEQLCVVILTDYKNIFMDYLSLDKMMFEYIYLPFDKAQALLVLARESQEDTKERKFRVFTEMRLNKLKTQFLKNAMDEPEYFRLTSLAEINDEYEMNLREGFYYVLCVSIDGTNLSHCFDFCAVLYHIILDLYGTNLPGNEFAVYPFRKYFLIMINNLDNLNGFIGCLQAICQAAAEINPALFYTISISKKNLLIPAIGEAIAEAFMLTRKHLQHGKNKIFFADSFISSPDCWKQIYTPEEHAVLLNLIDIGEIKLFEKWYDSKILQLTSLPEFTADSVFGMAAEIYQQLEKQIIALHLTTKKAWLEIKKEYQGLIENSLSIEELIKRLRHFTGNCINQLTALKQKPDERIFRVQKYIREHYMEDISLETVAAEVHLTKNYLCYLFKKKMAITLVDYLNTYRIERAKELLSETDMTLQEICPLVGIKDVKYFSRVFKKYVGVCPAIYRR